MIGRERQFDWHRVADEAAQPDAVDSRARLSWLVVGFSCMAALVFGKLVTLEWHDGARYRELASQPLQWRHRVPGLRGRILARDGTLLAEDERVVGLALHYRYLTHEPDATWLRQMARRKLPPAERRDAQRLADAEAEVRAERRDLHARLASLCGLTMDDWQTRCKQIEHRVTTISQNVNARAAARYTADTKQAATKSAAMSGASWWERAWTAVVDAMNDDARSRPPDPITVAEELEYHVLVDELSLDLVSEIESRADRYPGVRIIEQPRRHYPAGELAAHVLGHLGPVERQNSETAATVSLAEDRVGRMGIERQYETLLRGQPGEIVEQTNRSGQLLSTKLTREPLTGRDVILTLDRQLQSTAEALLDQALERRQPGEHATVDEQAGGAIVVLDVRNGDILAAASAPRFDPNWFAESSDTTKVADLLQDENDPLYDRVTRMAIAPGSVFKIVSAIALLESGGIDPHAAFACQGYLRQPDRQRCAIFTRMGVGHGETTLADALAESCNVYFFHHAAELGPAALVDWSLRLGFGRATGVDLPDESPGVVPTPSNIRELEDHTWRTADSQMLSIGQGSLTATPLQIARLLAVVANDGYLVTPRMVSHLGLTVAGHEVTEHAASFDETSTAEPPRRVERLSASTLDAVRQGLERAVADPAGTAHAGLYLVELPVAAKTGTAEAGQDRQDHAWLAGYAPLDRPRVAFVVALQHSGDGGTTAGPVARRLVLRLDELGYIQRRRATVANASQQVDRTSSTR